MNIAIAKNENTAVAEVPAEVQSDVSGSPSHSSVSADEVAIPEELDRRLYTGAMSSFFFTFMQAKNATSTDQPS